MPEATADAAILIAASFQAMNRAAAGDPGTQLCDCTVTVAFAGFYIEANLNHLIAQLGRENRGNDGARMFLWRAHLYMSYDEIRNEIQILRDNPNATATFKGLLDRKELGIKRAQQLWEGFNTRRMSLR